ncbi:MAG: hypothetical protein WD795_01995 [Woeseia sp.]
MTMLKAILVSCGFALLPLTAHAYVGPGAGLSLLGALWALIVAVGAALVFLVAWPIRRMRRRKREARDLEATEVEATEVEAAEVEQREHRENAARNVSQTSKRDQRPTAVVQPRDVNEPRRP